MSRTNCLSNDTEPKCCFFVGVTLAAFLTPVAEVNVEGRQGDGGRQGANK